MQEIWDDYVNHMYQQDSKQRESAIKLLENNYKKYFPKDKNARVLDIGYGRGEMLTCMKDGGGYLHYEGVDISKSTFNFCKSIGLQCALTDDVKKWLSSSNNRYEMITLLSVIQYIKKEEVVPYLNQIYQSLKPGGVFIIQAPNAQSPDSAHYLHHDIMSEVFFSEASLGQVLSAAGFTDISFYGFEASLSTGVKGFIKRGIRRLYWESVRLTRAINNNINPRILNPMIYAVARKE